MTIITEIAQQIQREHGVTNAKATRLISQSLAMLSHDVSESEEIDPSLARTIRGQASAILSAERRPLADVTAAVQPLKKVEEEAEGLRRIRDEAIYAAAQAGHTHVDIARAASSSVPTIDRALRRVRDRQGE